MAKKLSKQSTVQDTLRPAWDDLNLLLVSTDFREYDLLKLGELLNLLDTIKGILEDYDLKECAEGITLVNQFIGLILSEDVNYHTGMSFVFNFHEIFDEIIESLLLGNDISGDFEESILAFRRIFEADIDSIIASTADGKAVIQALAEDLDLSIIAEFISESQEGLELAEHNLLELEKDPSDQELISPLFRVVHTLKGTSGFLGLVVIGTVAHHFEDLLGQIREGDRVFTNQIFDAFFKSIDIFKQLISQVKDILEGIEPLPIDVDEVHLMLAVCLGVEDEPSTGSEKQSSKTNHTKNSTPQKEPASSPKTQNKSSAIKLDEMIKVPARKLDELTELVGELVVALSVLSQNPVIAEITDREAHERLDQLDKVTESLRDRILGVRMFPVGNVFSKLSRQVRDLAQKSGKQINLHLEGKDTLVDKTIIDGIYAPLMHLVRNGIDHGISEPEERKKLGKSSEGNIQLTAHHAGDSVVIEVKDDGKGLQRDAILKKALERGLIKEGQTVTDQQVFSFIFQAGFSTAKQVTDISGRGVGMDVVKRDIEHLRGKITIESEPGEGTTFTINLPLSTSIIEGLVVRIGSSRFVVPILEVNLTVTPKKEELQSVQGEEDEFFVMAGDLIPIFRLYQFYNIEPEITDPSKAIIIVIHNNGKKYGLMVDEMMHRQKVVIKNLGDRFQNLVGITGGTILGDGQVGLILEPEELVQYHQSVVN